MTAVHAKATKQVIKYLCCNNSKVEQTAPNKCYTSFTRKPQNKTLMYYELHESSMFFLQNRCFPKKHKGGKKGNFCTLFWRTKKNEVKPGNNVLKYTTGHQNWTTTPPVCLTNKHLHGNLRQVCLHSAESWRNGSLAPVFSSFKVKLWKKIE